MNPHDATIALYEAHRETLDALREEVEAALAPLLGDVGPKVHSISHRLKDPVSLRGKLARPDKTYGGLTDVTDLLGVRVVTYFEDGVADVARFVEGNLTVDFGNSVDKRKQAALDRFGYRSLHYVCYPPRGFVLPDALAGLRFEIQIRTILQHAWAEIEHDMGYKASAAGAIPHPIRRRFSRIAGLLEIADDAFVAIKREIEDYEAEVAARVKGGEGAVDIDHHSLAYFIRGETMARLDARVAGALSLPQSAEDFYLDYLVKMLREVGISGVDELRRVIEVETEAVVAFVPRYLAFVERAFGLTRASIGEVKRGYGLLFVAHLLLARDDRLAVERVERATSFFYDVDRMESREAARVVAVAFLEATRG